VDTGSPNKDMRPRNNYSYFRGSFHMIALQSDRKWL